jgi:hypothetical protein
MLGRFRTKRDAVQLEDLVAGVVGPETPEVEWFKKFGKTFRNSVAHGYWKPEKSGLESLFNLRQILLAVLPAYIAAWVELSDRKDRRPSPALIDHILSN